VSLKKKKKKRITETEVCWSMERNFPHEQGVFWSLVALTGCACASPSLF